MAGSREAKNSFSCIFTRSHGGLPSTALKPPVQPVGACRAVRRDLEDLGELEVPVEEPVAGSQIVDGGDSRLVRAVPLARSSSDGLGDARRCRWSWW